MGFQIFLFIGLVTLTLGVWANFQIHSTLRRYLRIRTPAWVNVSNMTHELLTQAKVARVRVEPLSSLADDHYDALKRRLRFSDPTGYSIGEFAMAAQETGLAIEHVKTPLIFWSFWGLSALAKIVATAVAIGLLLGLLLQFLPILGVFSGRFPEDFMSNCLQIYVLCALATLPMAYLRWQINTQILPQLTSLPEMKSEPTPSELNYLKHMMSLLIWKDMRDVTLVLPGIITSIKDWVTQPRR
jgi:Zn-dependent membrane protease YugP